MSALRIPLAERLARHSEPEPYSGCHLWFGAADKDGYGRIELDGRTVAATHAALIAAGRPVPAGLHALHKCDTPSCVNPAHLYAGTNAKNMRDKVERGRSARGERHGIAKLSNAQAASIRDSIEPSHVLADRFGVSMSAVQRIRAGTYWKEVA